MRPKSKSIKSNCSSTLNLTVTLLSLVVGAGAISLRGEPGNDNRAPEVPAALQVPAGNKVEFHAYASGVQIYVWTGSSWVFKAPEAVLFDSDGNVVGIHYAGPTWESESGSKVVGTRLAGSTVDAAAIPWLLLQAKTVEGP